MLRAPHSCRCLNHALRDARNIKSLRKKKLAARRDAECSEAHAWHTNYHVCRVRAYFCVYTLFFRTLVLPRAGVGRGLLFIYIMLRQRLQPPSISKFSRTHISVDWRAPGILIDSRGRARAQVRRPDFTWIFVDPNENGSRGENRLSCDSSFAFRMSINLTRRFSRVPRCFRDNCFSMIRGFLD